MDPLSVQLMESVQLMVAGCDNLQQCMQAAKSDGVVDRVRRARPTGTTAASWRLNPGLTRRGSDSERVTSKRNMGVYVCVFLRACALACVRLPSSFEPSRSRQSKYMSADSEAVSVPNRLG